MIPNYLSIYLSIRRCSEIGFSDFATKPLLPATLAGLLKKYINHDVP